MEVFRYRDALRLARCVVPAVERLVAKMKTLLRNFALRLMRRLVDRADEWLHERELEIAGAAIARREAVPAARSDEFDRKASAARERARRAARPRQPRLVYQHGEFVRREA